MEEEVYPIRKQVMHDILAYNNCDNIYIYP